MGTYENFSNSLKCYTKADIAYISLAKVRNLISILPPQLKNVNWVQMKDLNGGICLQRGIGR